MTTCSKERISRGTFLLLRRSLLRSSLHTSTVATARRRRKMTCSSNVLVARGSISLDDEARRNKTQQLNQGTFPRRKFEVRRLKRSTHVYCSVPYSNVENFDLERIVWRVVEI
jgi:hypothetical protein